MSVGVASAPARKTAQPQPQPQRLFEPLAPRSVEETGLNIGFLTDLALKIMYFEGYISGYEIADVMKLPFVGVVEHILEFLKREQFCEVKGSGGFGESAYQYMIADKGSDRAREVLDRSQYVGPAPVTLPAYTDAIHKQALKDIRVDYESLRAGLSHLVFNEKILNQIGPAVNSGRSMFLFGYPGNGKTSIAEAIGNLFMQGDMYIPYAMEVNGQVIKVFDIVNHRLVEEEAEVEKPGATNFSRKVDKRWARIKRPVIIVGGELTLEGLDLVYDDVTKFYEAPFQVKANGGLFLLDDFGRQLVRPQDLLNRWIVPLEKRIDYLTLQTGGKIEVPFDVLLIFSTNLEPRDLVDEAFLRRIRHKINVTDPTFEQFREIFKRVTAARGIPYSDQALAYLLQEHYIKAKRKVRACHPRDILDQIIDIARFMNVPPSLSKELIDKACDAYFVDLG
jgi:predicted ATPase with chaperone activity